MSNSIISLEKAIIKAKAREAVKLAEKDMYANLWDKAVREYYSIKDTVRVLKAELVKRKKK